MEALPLYTPEVLPGYDLTPATSISPSTRPSSPVSSLTREYARYNYSYRSERMELDLGTRKWGTKLPAYGRAAQIQGTLTIHSFKHVDRIVVRLIGKLNTSHVMNQIPTFSQSYTIIHKSHELWSSEAASSSGPRENVFPFTFNLDRDDGGSESLPPSATIQLSRAQAHIAYAIRIDMYRRGIHMHETLQTEVLYLPRTTSQYCRPFIPESGNEKRPRISDHEWHTLTFPSEPTKRLKPKPEIGCERAPALLLPRDLSYPSGQSIPFIISAPSLVDKDEVQVQLVRVSTVQTRAGVVQQVNIVSRGRIHPASEPTSTTIRGTFDTGVAGKEASWNFGSLARISYQVRAQVGSLWKVVQEVDVTSHEWHGQVASELPALGSSVVSRTAIHLMNMSV